VATGIKREVTWCYTLKKATKKARKKEKRSCDAHKYRTMAG